jgi:iron complex transport system ATP-binding protein
MGGAMNDPSMALVAKDIYLAYQKDRWVIRNLSVSVGVGRVLAILGPNGCGKTTLLKLFLGLLRPRLGSLERNGDMALVPQLFQVAFAFTALDMVLMGRARKIGLFSQPSKFDRELAMEALARFQIADLAARSFHELSGGQRQLVTLARALVAEAETLVLDEPTSALDLNNQMMILNWVERLKSENGLTIIFSTHLPQHALSVADEALLMMEPGEYVAGPVETVMTEENLKRLYGVDIKRLSVARGEGQMEALIPLYNQTRAFKV